jgi:hypothetical protein
LAGGAGRGKGVKDAGPEASFRRDEPACGTSGGSLSGGTGSGAGPLRGLASGQTGLNAHRPDPAGAGLPGPVPGPLRITSESALSVAPALGGLSGPGSAWPESLQHFFFRSPAHTSVVPAHGGQSDLGQVWRGSLQHRRFRCPGRQASGLPARSGLSDSCPVLS